MRKSFIALLVLLLCAFVNAAMAADSDPVLQKVLEGRYAQMKTAMAEHDAKAIAALLTPDFVSEDADGHTSTRDEMIAQVTSMAKDPNKVSETSLLAVHQFGETAEVKQRYRMTTTRLPAGADRPSEILLVTLSTDTWASVGGTWLMRRTVTEQFDLSVNGVPVGHKQHRQ